MLWRGVHRLNSWRTFLFRASLQALTGLRDIPSVQQAAGGVGSVLKPFQRAELRSAIEITLARCAAFQALAQEAGA